MLWLLFWGFSFVKYAVFSISQKNFHEKTCEISNSYYNRIDELGKSVKERKECNILKYGSSFTQPVCVCNANVGGLAAPIMRSQHDRKKYTRWITRRITIMPKRTDIKKVLIIGSGPIIIGQACEFDYSRSEEHTSELQSPQ